LVSINRFKDFITVPTKKRDIYFFWTIFAILITGSVAVHFLGDMVIGAGMFCPLNRFLHIRCIGCGATRATVCLCSGNLVTAVWYNPFYMLALCFLLWLYIRFAFNTLKRDYTPFRFGLKAVHLYTFLALGLAFWLIRNFDFYRAVFY